MNPLSAHVLSAGLLVAGILTGCQSARRGATEQGHAPAMPPSVPRALIAPVQGQERAADDLRQPRYSPSAIALFGQLPPAVTAASVAPDAPGGSPGAGDGSLPGGPQANFDNLRQMTFASEGDDFDPAVDPTGRFIVFASTRHRSAPDLYLQSVSGSAVTRLTDDPAWDVMPTFSPDGKRIAFSSNRSGNMDIYVMGLDGGQPVQITSDAAHDIHPSFSPDGRMLVYSTQSLSSGQWEMVVVDLERPGQKHYLGPGLFPRWSPVDNRIVFQRARQRGTRWFSIWTMDFVHGEGLHPTELAASANAACLAPHWSPDGQFIVFCTVIHPTESSSAQANPKPAQADIWVMNADGSGRVNLTNNAQVNTQPVWARDGRIYFVSSPSRFAPENIWSLRPDRALATLRHAEPVAASGRHIPQEKSAATATILSVPVPGSTPGAPGAPGTPSSVTTMASGSQTPSAATPAKPPPALVTVEDWPSPAAASRPGTPVTADQEEDRAGAVRSVQVPETFIP